MANYIITGISGYIGRNLAKELLDKGHTVFGFSRSNATVHFDTNKKNLKLVQGSISDINRYINLFNDIQFEAIFHLAWEGVNGLSKNNFKVQLNNFKNTLELFSFSNKISVNKFYGFGSISEKPILEYNDIDVNKNMYPLFKAITKTTFNYLNSPRVKFIWLEIANIYGSDNTTGNILSYTIEQLKKNKIAKFSQGNHPYDFLLIDDLIKILMRINNLKDPLNYYYVGSGNSRLLKDYLLSIGNIMGKTELIGLGFKKNNQIYEKKWFNVDNLISSIGPLNTTPFEVGINQYIGDSITYENM